MANAMIGGPDDDPMGADDVEKLMSDVINLRGFNQSF
jgi:hypothetical protein